MKLITDLKGKSREEIKVVATDCDGTLTNQGQLTAKVVEAISALETSGIAVILVTGRSAGWVNALQNYFPLEGAIAENGGVYYFHPQTPPEFLVSLPSLPEHRKNLETLFQQLRVSFPQLKEATDNPFRFTDWTFEIAGLSVTQLQKLAQQCEENGYSFTYSSVQGHLKPQGQDKAQGLQTVLKKYFPNVTNDQVLTIGDSPNDDSLFNPDLFPVSVGVSNIKDYAKQLTHPPQYVTQAAEGNGFCELATHLLNS